MSAISLRLADSLHKRVKELAQKEHVSINQFIGSALMEKISAFLTRDYIAERAKRGSRRKFLKVLSKIRNQPPDEQDIL